MQIMLMNTNEVGGKNESLIESGKLGITFKYCHKDDFDLCLDYTLN